MAQVWYHHTHGRATWPELKVMFATVGGITRRRLIMLGWRTSLEATNNPVNRILG